MNNMTDAEALAVMDDVLSTSTGMLPDECLNLRAARAHFAEVVRQRDELVTASKNIAENGFNSAALIQLVRALNRVKGGA